MLNEVLPVQLKTVGVNYLFVDFLRDWSVKKGVPLPLEASGVTKESR